MVERLNGAGAPHLMIKWNKSMIIFTGCVKCVAGGVLWVLIKKGSGIRFIELRPL